MSRSKSKVPAYCRQKVKGGHDRAFVKLNGHREWLGRYGSPESHERYKQVLADWKASGQKRRPLASNMTITELGVAFLRHAEQHYRKPARSTTSRWR